VFLYLVRHARSVGNMGDLGDEGRYLSAEGRSEAIQTGSALGARGVTPDLVLASPLVRAVQTAELLASALSFGGEVRSSLAMAPGVGPEVLLREIPSNSVQVLAVGHMPDMRVRTAYFLGRSLREVPSFTTSMVVCLSTKKTAPGNFAFEWAYLPEKDEVVELLIDVTRD
jgi:phosphohistidine phosphatase